MADRTVLHICRAFRLIPPSRAGSASLLVRWVAPRACAADLQLLGVKQATEYRRRSISSQKLSHTWSCLLTPHTSYCVLQTALGAPCLHRLSTRGCWFRSAAAACFPPPPTSRHFLTHISFSSHPPHAALATATDRSPPSPPAPRRSTQPLAVCAPRSPSAPQAPSSSSPGGGGGSRSSTGCGLPRGLARMGSA